MASDINDGFDYRDMCGSPMTVGDGELKRAISDVYDKHPVPGQVIEYTEAPPIFANGNGFKPPARTFDQFFKLVKDSVDGQAKRKGYTENGADGDNALFQFTEAIGVARGHAVGEIIYKLREYMHDPREVCLIKVCGWSYLLWKYGTHKRV